MILNDRKNKKMIIKALDFVNGLERARWIPRKIVVLGVSAYVNYFMPKNHRLLLRNIKPGDLVIDLGANVGLFSMYFLSIGAEVQAYEPDDVAFSVLTKNTSAFKNIKTHKAAVYDKGGTMRLYRHNNFEWDKNYTQSSSLLEIKNNMNTEMSFEVDVYDIEDVVNNAKKRIKLLKMDVEGAEINILKKILDMGLHKKIDAIVVETHEDSVPGLALELEILKSRIDKEKINNIDLTWF